MKKRKLTVSVVIPAYNASRTIEKCLDAISKQSYPSEYEIIVVDDGSKDNTKELIKRFGKVKYIYKENSGPAAARNVGWKAASGDVIVFTDSDCVPEENWLEEIVKPLDIDKKVVAVGGKYERTLNDDKKLAKLIGEEINLRYNKIGTYTDAHGSYSLAVYKKVLEKVGGFNEYYRIATAEDWDLCYKITEKGYKIAFCREAKVGHYHPENLYKYLRTQFKHGFYRMKLYKDHPQKVKGDQYSGNAKWIVLLNGILLIILVMAIFNVRYLLVGVIDIFCQIILLAGVVMSRNLKIMTRVEMLGLELTRGFAWTIGAILAFPKVYLLGK